LNNNKPADEEPLCMAPAIAYGHVHVHDMGRGDDHFGSDAEPLLAEIVDYRQYVFLGRLPIGLYTETAEAKAAARAKYGPDAKAFATARYWVCYRIA
jgi:hypothetical protein